MQLLKRHHNALSWVGGIAVAASIAVGGASTVLAEGPACTVDGRAISQEQAAADPTLCPDHSAAAAATGTPAAPADPAPAAAPAPAAGTPATPPANDDATAAPAATAPTTNAPTNADPAAAATADASATTAATAPAADPAAQDPAGTPPASEQPAATTQQPATTTDATAATTPTSAAPTPSTPAPKVPAAKHPGKPASLKPAPSTSTDAPAPKPTVTPALTTKHEVIAAKLYQVPFQDARLYREQYKPVGRIPEQPRLTDSEVDAFATAAVDTGTPWTTLAALAWTDSKWKHMNAASLRSAAVFLGTSNSNNPEAALRSYLGRTGHADAAHQTQIMADYYAAMGREAMTKGLDDAKVRDDLAKATLADERISIYDGGRSDIKAGLIDPRVLVTIRFLANRFHTVSISALISGHGVYTASGNVSLHALGQAVDVASLDGEIINTATQRKGGNTYHAVQDVLLLPKSMQPQELISLWAMGGASFALPDHNDHMHVGFGTESAGSSDGE